MNPGVRRLSTTFARVVRTRTLAPWGMSGAAYRHSLRQARAKEIFMLGFNRWHLFKMLAAMLCVVVTCSILLMYFVPVPPSKFIIATGVRNQTYEAIAKRYREILARSHVDLELRLTNGAEENIKLLNDPTSGIKVGIVQGGISDGDQSPDLLSLGRINYQIFWIFYNATDTRSLKL
jgi:hypothetical protein